MNKKSLTKEDQDAWLIYSKACQLGEYIRVLSTEALEQACEKLEASKFSSAYSEADRLALVMLTAARRAAESRA